MPTGVVKWFNTDKGYGFIYAQDPKEPDLFIHWQNIQGEGFRKLRIGDTVEYEAEKAEKGWQAVKVRVIKKAGE